MDLLCYYLNVLFSCFPTYSFEHSRSGETCGTVIC